MTERKRFERIVALSALLQLASACGVNAGASTDSTSTATGDLRGGRHLGMLQDSGTTSDAGSETSTTSEASTTTDASTSSTDATDTTTSTTDVATSTGTDSGTSTTDSGTVTVTDSGTSTTDSGTTTTGTDSGTSTTDSGTTSTASGPLTLAVGAVTSSTVVLDWTPPAGATAARVYLAAEPASTSGASLPGEVLVASLAGTSTTDTVSSLAPDVDAFLRVEVDTPSGTVASNVHARTVGGPRATLDNAVREVHAFGPNILQVVLHAGDGPTWQAGPWTVQRADGTAIAVTQVARYTIPVGAPDYQIGYNAPFDNSVIDIDHRIYLTLAAPIGTRDVLTITGPAVSFKLPFSDQYLETPVLQVNQVGYNPRATERWAYVSGWMGDGGPLSLASFPATADVLAEPSDPNQPRTNVVSGLAVTQRSALDADTAAAVDQIDLSSVPAAEGVRYRVRLPGVGVSWATSVSERAVLKAWYTITRGLFLNRWGGNLLASTTDWSRPADHATVYTGSLTDFTQMFPSTQPLTGQRPLVGGYHDAGDFDQRPTSTVVPELVLRAYEMNPTAFTDGQLTLPESGNGIPDLLDEALWGVAMWEQMQEADGGVRQGCESYGDPFVAYLANNDPLPYWTYSEDANVSARAAGIFAQASRLIAPFDAAHAAALNTRAVNAWNYAVANGAASPYRLYGAGELFLLTGNATYKTAFESAWTAMGASGAFSNFANYQLSLSDYVTNQRAVADYLMGYVASSGASSSIVSTTRSWLTNYATSELSDNESLHAHRNPRPTGYAMDWGQGTTMVRYFDTLLANQQMGGLSASTQQQYFNALSLAADYLLGCNPNGLSYVTGLGSRSPQEPLHLDSLAFVKMGMPPMPGLPVFGPIQSAPGTSYTLPAVNAFYPAFNNLPPGQRYADVRTFVTTSEFTVWEIQAPDTVLFSVLLAPGMTPPASWLPGNPDQRSTLP